MTAPATAAYLRVSSASQDLEMQRVAVERVAVARGELIARWYEEKRSARTIARPELDRLRADARAGHVNHIICFRLDRLTRSGIRDTFEIVEELRSHGCRLTTVADNFSLEGPAAEVVLAVMAWASKMERLAINERIAAARERARVQGRHWGRPQRMGPDVVARAREMQEGGRSIREISMALKVPKSTVMRSLSSPRAHARHGDGQPGKGP